LTLTGNSDVELGSNADNGGFGFSTVYGGSGDSNFEVLVGFGSDLTIVGGSNDDEVDASATASNITFIATLGGSDTFLGGSGNDDVLFASNSDLASSNIDGGVGTNDTIEFTAADTIVDSDFTDVANIEVVRLFGASTATFNTTAMGAGIETVYGGSGNNNITQGAGFTSNFDFIGQSNADSVTIQNAAQLANNDINGGTGTDTLTLGTAGTYANTDFVGISNMDVLVLANGTNDVTLGSSGIMAVYGGTGNDDIDASAYATAVTLYGGEGNTQSGADTLTGGSGGDWLQAWTNTNPVLNTSDDTLTGGAGADRFVLGNASGNAYGQAAMGDASNYRAAITDFNADSIDILVLDEAGATGSFMNNGTNLIRIRNAANDADVYRIAYNDGTKVASLYQVDGAGQNLGVATINNYTGTFSDATSTLFQLQA
jgi:Ca2+-binding RTX toxin-like protein